MKGILVTHAPKTRLMTKCLIFLLIASNLSKDSNDIQDINLAINFANFTNRFSIQKQNKISNYKNTFINTRFSRLSQYNLPFISIDNNKMK